MMLSPEARAACAKYVLDQARHVIDTFGPRGPGSEGERAAQEYAAARLEELGATEVQREPFFVAPEAFMRFQTVAGVLMLVACAVWWFMPPLALLPGVLAFFVTWRQFVHYHPMLDALYPQSESLNVYARWAPRGETRRRIILNAHMDAAFEWRYHVLWPKAFPWLVRYSLAAMPAALVLEVASIPIWMGDPGSIILWWLGGLQALLVPAFVLALFFTNFENPVPGANDNLSGVFLAAGVIRALREAESSFENTEIACLITGSEEAGLRGASAWAARHAKELRDADTAILVLDTIRDRDHFTVYQGDLNGTVRNDEALSQLVAEAAAACGHTARIGTIPLGATDAAAFTRARLKATALVAMNPAPARFYHTRFDSADNMDAGCVAIAAGIVGEVIRRFDEGGAPG